MEASTRSSFVRTPQQLRQLCDRLRSARRIGLDTEFVSERRYSPELGIIQVAVEDWCAIIDPQTVPDLTDFCEVIFDSRIEKILHAGRQDLEIFHRLGGRVLSPIFDTQIAAALVGYGEQIAYARLVERLVGVTLCKHESFTNWNMRPLSARQVEYALDDVRYLLLTAERLRSRLRRLGRVRWAKEEFARLEEGVHAARMEPRERYRRVRGWSTLSSRGLAILRELTSWRESEAERRNRPRGRVIPDEILVELARRAPTNRTALQSIRALNPGIVKRQANDVLKAVQRGLQVSESQLPSLPKQKASGSPPPGLVELLSCVLRARSEEVQVAPGILATRGDLERLASDSTCMDSLTVLQGWRLDLVGRELLEVLNGQRGVGFDPNGRKVKNFPMSDEDGPE